RTAIDTIESPSVTVMTTGPFLPKSEQEIILNWRNVKQVELAIRTIDIVSDLRLSGDDRGQWQRNLPAGGSSVRRWGFQTNDRGDHAVGGGRIRLTPKLEPGAYVLSASATGAGDSRALLLVTDANVIVHQASGRADIFVCNAITGEPMANARVRVWWLED